MKNIHVCGLVIIGMLVLAGVASGPAAAATLQWLLNGGKIVAPVAAETTGEFELGEETEPKDAMLCSAIFVGTAGPGVEDSIAEVLNLQKVAVNLDNQLSCNNVRDCEEALASFINLPWLTNLELMGTETAPLFLDEIMSGGQGQPGFETVCTIPVLGRIEEECVVNVVGFNLENDAAESDVLAALALEVIFTCEGRMSATGWMSTEVDGANLMTSTAGTLSVSYE
jgi:hypothetical protein